MDISPCCQNWLGITIETENLENYSKLTSKPERPPANPLSVHPSDKYLVHGLSVGDIVFVPDIYDFHISLTLIYLSQRMVACASA